MTPAESRASALARFRADAARIFLAQPHVRSVLLAISHFYNISGDAIDALIVVSLRDVPVWPSDYGEEAGAAQELWPGQIWRTRGDPDFEEIADDAVVDLPNFAAGAFLQYCFGPQWGTHQRRNYVPYAIARRSADDDVLLEIVCKLVRPAMAMIPDEPEQRPWLAIPRAAALYDLVGANPADDEPRRVLADHLLEHDHPRGELIALMLAGELDAAAAARRDDLLAMYGRQWISPLGAVIPEGCAHWERGFLSRADVYVRDDVETPRGAAAWRTVETIRFLGGNDAIDLEMVALRDVGPVRNGLYELVTAPRPWAIERLIADLDDDVLAFVLWSTTTLPRLTHLVLCGKSIGYALAQPRPPWWQQLERLTLWFDSYGEPADGAWIAAQAGLAPWVAVSHRCPITRDPGWEIAISPDQRVEVSLAGWHDEANHGVLARRVATLPDGLDVVLVPSRYWAPTAEDAVRIARAAGRAVRIES